MLHVTSLEKTFCPARRRARESPSARSASIFRKASSSRCSARPVAERRRRCAPSLASNGRTAARSPSGPNVVFDSERQIFVPPNKRQIGMVFQSYAIWPHMNVFENVAFPLRVGSSTRTGRRSRGGSIAFCRSSSLRAIGGRPATRLSGGQQQRLALARALDGRAGFAAARRAAEQSRRQAPRIDAVRTAASATGGRRDDGVRHPRPDRGACRCRTRLR